MTPAPYTSIFTDASWHASGLHYHPSPYRDSWARCLVLALNVICWETAARLESGARRRLAAPAQSVAVPHFEVPLFGLTVETRQKNTQVIRAARRIKRRN